MTRPSLIILDPSETATLKGSALPHPDLAHEQAHIDRAYACLDAMRAETARLMEGELGTTEVDTSILKHELQMRLASLSDQHGPLCFGRIDEEGGARHYIGRRHVKDASDHPVVVDWRAAVAAPFYRATIRDALGLRLRRRFVLEERELQEIFEEDFADPDSVAAGHGGVPDPLLAELGRARTGEMRDIVATIQGEQDEIIRRPADDLVIVQGGPGTGKTAVGLHRAAFLLYERRIELERDGVLVVGPNPTFLEYISGVLPSLGETSVRQATIEGIFGGRHRVSVADTDEVARLKGDERMTDVVRRACLERVAWPGGDLIFDVSGRSVRLQRDEVAEAIEKSLTGARDLKTGRELFTDRLQRSAYRLYAARHDPSLDEADFLKQLRSSRSFKVVRDRLWPSISATQVVRGLLAGGEALAGAAEGLLSADEIALLGRARPPRSGRGPWARGDLPLIDEAETMLSGPSFTYGHVIVDEAQDLSPMELRMVGRRSKSGAMTVLGDLAQATGLGAQMSWDGVIRYLDVAAPPKRFDLTVGYRVPGPIMDFANRLLPEAAPHVAPTESIRADGAGPRIVEATEDELLERVWEEAGGLSDRWPTVGVVAPGTLESAAAAAFTRHAPEGRMWRAEHLDTGITLLPPATAKGLEFDAVVVVEPALIAAEERHGARTLYVALTRAVQELTIVHSRPLPRPLRDAGLIAADR